MLLVGNLKPPLFWRSPGGGRNARAMVAKNGGSQPARLAISGAPLVDDLLALDAAFKFHAGLSGDSGSVVPTNAQHPTPDPTTPPFKYCLPRYLHSRYFGLSHIPRTVTERPTWKPRHRVAKDGKWPGEPLQGLCVSEQSAKLRRRDVCRSPRCPRDTQEIPLDAEKLPQKPRLWMEGHYALSLRNLQKSRAQKRSPKAGGLRFYVHALTRCWGDIRQEHGRNPEANEHRLDKHLHPTFHTPDGYQMPCQIISKQLGPLTEVTLLSARYASTTQLPFSLASNSISRPPLLHIPDSIPHLSRLCSLIPSSPLP
ncbi:hypothetical protein N658DRAFT_282228 [Parathielavia hyrcaniae]|uniref:Uncharacterized protein n=1 Tax=Parathielavia hyrcaniae TaxID=113614 RepID=A0AAN6Q4W3_9PEZI|nr:hypothetical protein N658DRAFT_282228 [Parathielavia hyrcaniae]